MVPHGISLSKRSGGKMQLYVVNHGGRQSIEMFELKPEAGSWSLIWHGCALTMAEFNDVAALPDGGFIATHPTSLRKQGDTSDLFSGQPSGVVARWTPGKGEMELPGTEAGYPNGVLVSADGRYMYFNAWTAKEVHKYDLKAGKEVGVVKLDFMPDNITWTPKHQMLAAGVKGTRGNCPATQQYSLRTDFRSRGNRARKDDDQDSLRFRRQGAAHQRRIGCSSGGRRYVYWRVSGRPAGQNALQAVIDYFAAIPRSFNVSLYALVARSRRSTIPANTTFASTARSS